MDFSNALKLLKEGKNIRRQEWKDGAYIYLREHYYIKGRYEIVDEEGMPYLHSWMTAEEDILANDWEEAEDE